MPTDGLSVAFAQHAQTMPQARLGTGSWQLESDVRGQLRDKLTHGHATLKQVCGSPLSGIKTGLEEAFVIDSTTRDRMITADPRSAVLLKPFFVGKDLKKWRVEPQDLWLILCPKGWTRQQSGLSDEAAAQAWMTERYPAVMRWLAPFETAAKKRGDKGEFWWELRACVYYDAFEQTKIVYADISLFPKFSLDLNARYLPTTGFAIQSNNVYLLGLLNSKAIWILISQICPSISGGFFRLKSQYIETLPIPAASDSQRSEIATLAEACQHAAEARRDCQAAFRHRIGDLASAGEVKLNTKLQHWWELDFSAFRAEVKKLLKQDIPLAERNDWESYFNSQHDTVQTYTAQIAQHEAALNRAVYVLFNLTPDEIALIEQT